LREHGRQRIALAVSRISTAAVGAFNKSAISLLKKSWLWLI